MFRFDYSPEFLRWALQPPGWKEQWHVGIRVAASKKLVAFISAIPMTIFAVDKTMPMVEINFLCVHKKLRNKRFSPVLIKEITRRVHLTGVFQAVYTAGITIPTPIATCPYNHRPLNLPKLVDIKFSYIPKDSTMEQEIEKYKLPDTPTLALRPMEEKDVEQVHEIFNEFNSQFKLAPIFDSKDTTRHWHMPIDKVNYSFVVEDEDGKIQDFISFYRLNSSVLFHEEHQTLNIAYLNYYCTRRFNAAKGPEGQSEEEKVQYKAHITELIRNLLIVSNKVSYL
jgi:glycylpeptide N-tetradecanoyltransferase